MAKTIEQMLEKVNEEIRKHQAESKDLPPKVPEEDTSKSKRHIDLEEFMISKGIGLSNPLDSEVALPPSQKEIQKKLSKLRTVSKQLKVEFIGIDSQIDQIISSLKAWYIFPMLLNKPLIINLWGITGTFKTSLIRRLVDLIDKESSYREVDARDLTSYNAMGHLLDIDMYRYRKNPNSISNNLPSVITIDEFQNARTIKMNGEEQNTTSGMASIFGIMSDGRHKEKVSRLDSDSYSTMLEELGSGYFEEYHINQLLDGGRGNNSQKYLSIIEAYPESYKSYIYYSHYKNNLKQLGLEAGHITAFGNDMTALRLFIEDVIFKYPKEITIDISKSLIFVCGNIDEAFSGLTYSLNNNIITPDEFYRESSKVNFNDIKKSLLQRFRAEQVARLGSNHVIFPSFNAEMYLKLIHSLNNRTLSKVKDMKVVLVIDKSVDEYILEHMAVPSQGARSVLSAHEYLVDSNIPEVLSLSMLNGRAKVRLSVVKDNLIISVKTSNIKKSISIVDKRTFKNYKEPINTRISLHEAGHAVVGFAMSGQWPDLISVRNNTMGVGGYCKTSQREVLQTANSIKRRIASTLGGYAAELLRYGDGEVSEGSYSDIATATRMASQMVRATGLGSRLSASGFGVSNDVLAVDSEFDDAEEIDGIIQECFTLAQMALLYYNKEHKELTNLLKKQVITRKKEIEKHMGGK